jgi:hypothetical protein
MKIPLGFADVIQKISSYDHPRSIYEMLLYFEKKLTERIRKVGEVSEPGDSRSYAYPSQPQGYSFVFIRESVIDSSAGVHTLTCCTIREGFIVAELGDHVGSVTRI